MDVCYSCITLHELAHNLSVTGKGWKAQVYFVSCFNFPSNSSFISSQSQLSEREYGIRNMENEPVAPLLSRTAAIWSLTAYEVWTKGRRESTFERGVFMADVVAPVCNTSTGHSSQDRRTTTILKPCWAIVWESVSKKNKKQFIGWWQLTVALKWECVKHKVFLSENRK